MRVAVIAAKGHSHRFGGCKALALWEGESLLSRACRAAVGSIADEVVLCTESDRVAAAATSHGVSRCVRPPHAATHGTVRHKLHHVARVLPAADEIVLLMVNVPRITSDTLNRCFIACGEGRHVTTAFPPPPGCHPYYGYRAAADGGGWAAMHPWDWSDSHQFPPVLYGGGGCVGGPRSVILRYGPAFHVPYTLVRVTHEAAFEVHTREELV